MRRPLTVFGLAVTFAVAPALATTILPVSDETLVDRADFVVRGRVLATEPVEIDGWTFTESRIEVTETIVGEPEAVLTLRTWGGDHADGSGTVVFGAPRPAVGDELLLFLDRHDDTEPGVYSVVDLNQGYFGVVTGGVVAGRGWTGRQGAVALRATGETRLVDPDGGSTTAAATTGRDVERFLHWVRARSRGAIDLPQDYRVEIRDVPGFEKYSTIGNQQARWFEFDRGESVTWLRHAAGQAGLPGGGEREFKRALRLWNDEPNTPVRLVDGGTTETLSRDVNYIDFRDLSDRIGGRDDFDGDCRLRDGGGVAAIGGYQWTQGIGTWRGGGWRRIRSAFVVINEVTHCLYRDDSQLWIRLYAHELGHTLGLGHPCERPDADPGCSTRAAEREVMNSGGPRVFDGLGPDDVEGLRLLYDASWDPATSCYHKAGTPDFCRDCGPCAFLNGGCRDDDDCLDGLVCTEDAGIEWGYEENIDLCLGGGTSLPICFTLYRGRAGAQDACSAQCPCELGQGDCDNDGECVPGAVCRPGLASFFGLPETTDVCIPLGISGDCPLPAGHPDFCAVCGPCSPGEGDCEPVRDCEAGTVCTDDIGALFGYHPAIDVCTLAEPPGCHLDPGHEDFCSRCSNACDDGQGDCDGDFECAEGALCVADVGAEYGFAADVDVCIATGFDDDGVDDTGGECPLPPGHGNYCRDCGPCTAGEGDCDRDTDCANGLVCTDDIGATYGFGPRIDVCTDPGGGGGGGGACPLPPGHGDYCRECGPCTAGEGDCDRDSDCATGLACTDDVGATFGFGPGIDVCTAPGGGSCSLPPGHGDYCRECGPCASGEGDCDRDSDCAAGLACTDDVGATYGFGPGIDVCTAG